MACAQISSGTVTALYPTTCGGGPCQVASSTLGGRLLQPYTLPDAAPPAPGPWDSVATVLAISELRGWRARPMKVILVRHDHSTPPPSPSPVIAVNNNAVTDDGEECDGGESG